MDQPSLFKTITRDERQEESRVNWIKSKCKGTIEACTGYGKSRVGLNCIKTLLNKYPDKRILIVVPTIPLKEQWIKHIDEWGFSLNCDVQVINTVITQDWKCCLLILDECHRFVADQMREVFNKVKYNLILGLTATIERLDGKHELLKKYCPVCDRVTLEVALLNGWVANYKEYLVLIDVDDIQTYKEYNKEFVQHFEFFGFDFNRALSCLGKNGFIERSRLRDEMCPNGTPEQKKEMFKMITYHATAFMRVLQSKKAFINNHPKKIELAKAIIEARPNSKIITFSNNVKMAESIGYGNVYTGKDSKKKSRITMDEFKTLETGILNTCQRCNEGVDIPGLSVAIMLGIDSSKIKALQKKGRVIRKEGNKVAEIFNLVINQSVELEWYKKSHEGSQYITIDEQGLYDVLEGKEPKPYVKPISQFQFRY